MALPKTVRLVEVGPRDGLQNEKCFLATEDKVTFINALSKTGLRDIEVSSFVSEKAIPQLKDASDVFKAINREEHIHYHALVPNLTGLERALEAGVKNIALFSASSNTFTQKNIGCDVDESLRRFQAIFAACHDKDITIRAYLSCVIACPYEGQQSPTRIAELTQTLFDMGADEVSLGDTIGVGTPKSTAALLNALNPRALANIGMHFHNTFGQALANIYQSLLSGITTFDSSVAGLGGCPYAKGASGNVATEDVVYLMDGLGIETGVDLNMLAHVGDTISRKLNRPNLANAGVATLMTK